MLHEEVAQIPVVPTIVTMLSVAKHATLALMVKRLYSLWTEEEKTGACFIEGFVCYSGITQLRFQLAERN